MGRAFHDAGLRRGDRVATLTGNTPEHVQVFFACAKAGADPRADLVAPAAPEIQYQLDDSDPSIFLVEDEYAELATATGWALEVLATWQGV